MPGQGRGVNPSLSANSTKGKGDFGGNAALDVWVTFFTASYCFAAATHRVVMTAHTDDKKRPSRAQRLNPTLAMEASHIFLQLSWGLQEQVATNV